MKTIQRVAVLGAGVMGSAIAAHLANAGLEVLLLDRVPDKLTAAEDAQGLTPGVKAFADRVRTAGNQVRTPDLFDGRTFSSVDAGVAYAEEVGFAEMIRRGAQAADGIEGGPQYTVCALQDEVTNRPIIGFVLEVTGLSVLEKVDRITHCRCRRNRLGLVGRCGCG